MRSVFLPMVTAISLATVSALAGCAGGQITISPQAAAKLNCALAADGATVIAVLRPGVALPANAVASIGCDLGTQVGDIIGSAK